LAAKRLLQLAERLSRRTATAVVTDSRAVVNLYNDTYGFAPQYIPYGAEVQRVSSSAYAFVETSEVGGTRPALLEATGLGSAVIVNGTLENRETIAEAGLTYEGSGGIGRRRCVAQLAHAASERASSTYSWETVTDQYEMLFRRLTKDVAR